MSGSNIYIERKEKFLEEIDNLKLSKELKDSLIEVNEQIYRYSLKLNFHQIV